MTSDEAEIFEELVRRMDKDIADGKYADKANKKSGFRSTQMCALLDQHIQAKHFTRANVFGEPPVRVVVEKPVGLPKLLNPPIEVEVPEVSLPNIGHPEDEF